MLEQFNHVRQLLLLWNIFLNHEISFFLITSLFQHYYHLTKVMKNSNPLPNKLSIEKYKTLQTIVNSFRLEKCG